MDNRQGEFKEIDPKKFMDQMQQPKPMAFQEGEIIDKGNIRFRVERIEHKRLILKLLDPISALTKQPTLRELYNIDDTFGLRGSQFQVEEIHGKRRILKLKLLPQL